MYLYIYTYAHTYSMCVLLPVLACIFLRMMFDEREIQLLAASISVVAICLFVSWKKLNVVKDGGKRYPPSMPILPIFGAMFRGGMTVLPDHFMKSTKDHGPIFSFTIGKR